MVANVPSTTPIIVALTSPVGTLSGHAKEDLSACSREVLAVQLEAMEDYEFGHEICRTSASRVGATQRMVISTTAETASMESRKVTIEAAIPLQAKEAKSGGSARKDEKQSGQSGNRHEKDIPTRR